MLIFSLRLIITQRTRRAGGTFASQATFAGKRRPQQLFGQVASVLVTIVRGAGREIVLDGDLVSDNHAHLEISDGKVLFQDLGSANGSLFAADCAGTQP